MPHEVVLITGASRGIGRATAHLLAERGFAVALVARDAARLDQVAGELHERDGRALALPADVADVDQMRGAVDHAERALGPVGVLVHAAAVLGQIAPIASAEPCAWARTATIDLVGSFNACHAVLPGMLDRGAGCIIALSSRAATNPIPGWSAYAAAKAGLNQLMRVLCNEVRGRGIRTYAFDPWLIDSDMQAQLRALPPEAMGGENLARFRRLHATGGLRPPGEAAAIIAWLIEHGPMPTPETAVVTALDPDFRRTVGVPPLDG